MHGPPGRVRRPIVINKENEKTIIIIIPIIFRVFFLLSTSAYRFRPVLRPPRSHATRWRSELSSDSSQTGCIVARRLLPPHRPLTPPRGRPSTGAPPRLHHGEVLDLYRGYRNRQLPCARANPRRRSVIDDVSLSFVSRAHCSIRTAGPTWTTSGRNTASSPASETNSFGRFRGGGGYIIFILSRLRLAFGRTSNASSIPCRPFRKITGVTHSTFVLRVGGTRHFHLTGPLL